MGLGIDYRKMGFHVHVHTYMYVEARIVLYLVSSVYIRSHSLFSLPYIYLACTIVHLCIVPVLSGTYMLP